MNLYFLYFLESNSAISAQNPQSASTIFDGSDRVLNILWTYRAQKKWIFHMAVLLLHKLKFSTEHETWIQLRRYSEEFYSWEIEFAVSIQDLNDTNRDHGVRLPCRADDMDEPVIINEEKKRQFDSLSLQSNKFKSFSRKLHLYLPK